MAPRTLATIAAAVDSTDRPADLNVDAVCTDTRHMVPASLFVALVGENFNGHRFLGKAAAGGAAAAIVHETPDDVPAGLPLIRVDDTRKALGRLARYVRRNLKSAVIGVAGSNGKTSTKHLIDACLRGSLAGSISPKSFNNDIGVPLTIFAADPSHDYLVLEIGTNRQGEIRTLTDIARPDIAIITNAGAEHLEGLTNLAGVRRENASVIEGMPASGTLIVNGDDAELVAATAAFAGKTIRFGFEPHNDFVATDVAFDAAGTAFRINGGPAAAVPMMGRHAAANALAALAVARVMGINQAAAIAGLATASSPAMRLQLQQVEGLGVTLINDAYNANPSSMRAALETIRGLPAGRRIAVLGDMRELGDDTDAYHREVGQLAATCKLDVLACVGEKAALIAEAAGAGVTTHLYPDAIAAADGVRKLVRAGDLVLLKASRSMKLERVADKLLEQA